MDAGSLRWNVVPMSFGCELVEVSPLENDEATAQGCELEETRLWGLLEATLFGYADAIFGCTEERFMSLSFLIDVIDLIGDAEQI